MTTPNPVPFESAVAASQQVAETLKALRQQREKIVSEIRLREDELQQHQAAPLPESDLLNFFVEYVDATAELGRQEMLRRLTGLLYPQRYASVSLVIDRKPLGFDEISQILDPKNTDWLKTNLPQVLPYLNAAGDAEQGRAILSYLLQDQIKDGLRKLFEVDLIKYHCPEKVGLPLAARRERISVLHAELDDFKAQQRQVDGQIKTLQGGVL
ncbi:MAG TPA: hypothetical protein PLU47_14305 [Azonexus sp.]|nr:hypothetical protein [Azonexus sp.]